MQNEAQLLLSCIALRYLVVGRRRHWLRLRPRSVFACNERTTTLSETLNEAKLYKYFVLEVPTYVFDIRFLLTNKKASTSGLAKCNLQEFVSIGPGQKPGWLYCVRFGWRNVFYFFILFAPLYSPTLPYLPFYSILYWKSLNICLQILLYSSFYYETFVLFSTN